MLAAAGQRLVFQCLKGGRGAAACAAVAGRWPEAYNLDGGIEGWNSAGLPVVRAAGTALPLFWQVQIAVGLGDPRAGRARLRRRTGLLRPRRGAVALMLAVAGVTGWCGMALLLARMPWNRPA